MPEEGKNPFPRKNPKNSPNIVEAAIELCYNAHALDAPAVHIREFTCARRVLGLPAEVLYSVDYTSVLDVTQLLFACTPLPYGLPNCLLVLPPLRVYFSPHPRNVASHRQLLSNLGYRLLPLPKKPYARTFLLPGVIFDIDGV